MGWARKTRTSGPRLEGQGIFSYLGNVPVVGGSRLGGENLFQVSKNMAPLSFDADWPRSILRSKDQ